ncbi:MAG: ABC transporter ATP-binding protein [Stygiobacter sp. RIFOXYC12_FULL_38_8]|nr:MAG: ABC transporter ATP-binding protein [Stygiobacter sp. GWC2_38_9]OGU82319.1 MAG: ABC transporter ATP-binding protein [Stygiobacter sp. RIFOXYA12_FULL_38_9]OGV06900.1 MAG: ABC transporter ATP-binding protein [Stygiobacter sp. RIFOXYB2_FULL_37_11]OGV11568.1 MAG: ABC transporter ATP-binding protein [Stygiobacter sp. RIFOXYA2_FULL_38_8]OGV13359.1 MAG: ABC transporter ATP-binding protein [Stygiobacter sp. RIFOXYC2_FULL_38_25]OGV30307.1 MAG: ABC transporter ATP-binding protein [Stygiobacter s
MADNKLVEIKNLSKRFETLSVLDDISIDVLRGENLVVFGRSGQGKSVLLKCIIGLMHPDAGKIYIKGNDISLLSMKELNGLRKDIGFLFQGSALYDSMTVRENLEFPLQKHFPDKPQKEIDEKVLNTLELVSLEDAIDKMPSELSGGMKKRIGLARSIITDPELMLYDEPTTGLDPITTKEISELIINLQKKLNMTSIVVTHDLICAEIIADRAIFLRDAKIAYEGNITELTNSADPFLRNFFSHELVKE